MSRIHWRLWLALLCSLAVLMVSSLHAASAREEREFKAAERSFNGGDWSRAEKEFAQFVAEHPASDLAPHAILWRGRSLIELKKFDASIALFSGPLAETNALADQFLFWKAEAQSRRTNFADAATTFGQLAAKFESSPLRLEAAASEAASRAKLGDWPRVVEVLKSPEGSFQKAARGKLEDKWATRGFLLLAEAHLQQRNYREAEAALSLILTNPMAVDELAWEKQYLLCRSQLGDGRAGAALDNSTNLVALAERGGHRDLLAKSIAFRARVLEQQGRLDEARVAFGRNVTNAPPSYQRQALAKVAELALAQNRPREVLQTLEWFVAQFTNSTVTDLALLTLGELYLKQHLTATTNGVTNPTNQLSQALTNFDRLIANFPNSPLVGKAQLNRGWCFWSEKRFGDSAEAFRVAVTRLSPSEDLVVARFKLADAQFVQKDFTNALQNYRASQAAAQSWPQLKTALASQSLYQELRASMELGDLPGATNAMQRILETYPQSVEADRSVLLVAQGWSDLNQPGEARAYFQKFLDRYPESSLRAEVELAMARATALQADWAAVIPQYDSWLTRYSTNALRPQAEFYRAMAHSHVGDESKTLNALTNFVMNFPTNELAAQAQWWVADHYLQQGDLLEAEIRFIELCQKLPTSSLAYLARMEAGKVALKRGAVPDAIEHFTKLTSNAECPIGLRIDAMFAWGGALRRSEAPGTNRLARVQDALTIFKNIPQDDPKQAALAWGEIASCHWLLATRDESEYANAQVAFQNVTNSPAANIDARSQAKVGLGEIAEKLAETRNGEAKATLLRDARDHYLDVFYEKILRDGEESALYWVKRAGMNAARVIELTAESPEDWEKARKLYQDLQKRLPLLSASLEKQIDRVRERIGSQEKER